MENSSPEIDAAGRELHLAFRGDWGIANLYAICGWVAAGMRMRAAPDSTFVVHTGRGGVDNIDALLDGEVDMALTTPIVTADMARLGRGLYDTPHPELMAIAALPHRDRVALCITAEAADEWGLRSLADLPARQPRLRLAVPPNDPDHAISWAIHRALEAHGCGWDDIARWGGEMVELEWPHPAVAMVAAGEADGIFYEAVMLWHQFLDARPMRFVAMEQAVLQDLGDRYGYRTAVIEPGEYPGVTEPVPTLDFSQFLVMVRADLDEDVAALMARTMVEDRAMLEARYRHLPLDKTPLLYPLDPAQLCVTDPVPLHPGAARYYRSIGLPVAQP